MPSTNGLHHPPIRLCANTFRAQALTVRTPPPKALRMVAILVCTNGFRPPQSGCPTTLFVYFDPIAQLIGVFAHYVASTKPTPH